MKLICQNRRARREYEILETLEAGIVLRGTEVKSLREARANISDAYADVEEGELYLVNLHISPYKAASHFGHDPIRRRKLLVHRRELERLRGKIQERGLTLIPLRLYFEGSWAKVELGLARGKKMYDRRRELAERESQREMARAMRRRDDRDRTRGGGGGRGRFLLGLSLLLLSLLTAGWRPGAGAAGAEEITVSWGGRAAPEKVQVRRSEGGLYFSMNAVGRWWGAVKEWDPAGLSLRVLVGEHEARLLADNPWVVLDESPVNLPVAIRVWEGVVWVPLDFVRRATPVMTGLEARWDPGRALLTFLPPGTNVLDLTMRSITGEALEVRVALSEPLEFSLDATRPGEVLLRILGGVLDVAAAKKWKPLLPVREIMVNQAEGFADVVFVMAVEGGTVTAIPVDEGRGIVLRLAGIVPDEAPALELLELRPLPPPVIARAREAGPPLVVIDPGHGGDERGAVGPSGFLEKKANLEIAKALERILEQEDGFRVELTRVEDMRVPLLRRAEMGNLFGSRTFLSIHCNGWPGPGARGFEVYHLQSVRKEEAAEDPADSLFPEEGRPLRRQGDLNLVLWDLAQEDRLAESGHLAALVSQELSRLGLSNRGVKEGRFIVLEGVRAPAVLVETGFITNPVEEGLLRMDSFRERVARALAEAMRRFATEEDVP